MTDHVTQEDLDAVAAQLGREPRGVLAIAYRCPDGAPGVVKTAPKLPDLYNECIGLRPKSLAEVDINKVPVVEIDKDGEVVTGYMVADNYFELYPDEPKVVTLEFDRPQTAARIRRVLTHRSLVDTY